MIFRRRRDGLVKVRLSRRNREMIAQLPSIVASADSSGDPGHDILHRPAFPEDQAESEAFADLVSDDVDRRRRRDAAVAEKIGSGAEAIDTEEAHALMRVINEARLVLAARSGAFERGPGWERGIRRDPALATVAWLGFVQSDLVETLNRP